MAFDLKTATPEALGASYLLFGAPTQSSADPSIHTVAAVKTRMLSDFSANGLALGAAANYAAMRTLLDLEAGTDFYSVAASDAAIAAAIAALSTVYQPLAANLTEWAGINPSANGGSLVAAADYAAMRALLDLEAGTDFLSVSAIAAAYQPLDADLTAIAALTTNAAGRGLLTLSNPGADRVLFWDNSAGAYTHLTIGTGLAITDTTLEATGGGGGGLGSLVEDLTPQLGGDLDLNSQDITGTGNINITGLAALTSIELGHASDTTLSRLSAGLLGVEGKALAFRDVTVNAQTGTSFTPALTDAGSIITMDNGSANTFTVPTNAAVAYPVGTILSVQRLGSGVTTVLGDTGVTINGISAHSIAIAEQYQSLALLKVATNTWTATTSALDADLVSWAAVTRASGFDTFAATPSSANLRALLTDESGSAALYFQGGDLGTPSAGVLTNATGLPPSGISGLVGGFGATISGGGSAITTGFKGYIVVPYAMTITSWTLLGDQSGSIVIDVWKDTYANAPPLVADSITASAKPTISAATKAQSSTLTGWTTSVAAGDVIGFNVDSITTLTQVTILLQGTRT